MPSPSLPSTVLSRRRTGRVLVVDDIAANRLMLRELLEPLGHKVVEAGDRAAAVELATAQPPDVVLLDVQMPGIDGFEVCRRLKAREATQAVPVVLVTVLDDRSDRIEGIRAGADDFLAKPVDRMDLGLRVGNAIAGHSLFPAAQAQHSRLRELESMRDALVQLMVHDLRSPLAGLRMSLEMAQMRVGESDPEAARMLSSAMQSTRRIARIAWCALARRRRRRSIAT